MPSQMEIKEVLVDLACGLSGHAINKLVGPGLLGVSPADQVKFRRILSFGKQDEADQPFVTAAVAFFLARARQSAVAALQDLGLTDEQLPDMSVHEFRRLLEEHWVAELERVVPP